jgi:NADH:ubiquinone oxidoreductase subunit 2 (subunit N)
MKDSAWVYVKDKMLLSVLLVMEIGLIPFHEVNDAYYRAKKKMDT